MLRACATADAAHVWPVLPQAAAAATVTVGG